MRILGPNCLGFISPARGINASFAHLTPLTGGLAFISHPVRGCPPPCHLCRGGSNSLTFRAVCAPPCRSGGREQRRGRAPQARLTGFSIEEMIRRPQAFELLAGIADDPVFGPVILFGQGGTAAEIIRDRAIGLPPLNHPLAREMIGRTRVARLLEGYRDRPAAAIDEVALTLVKLSQLLIDVPEITELDINPLIADSEGVLALDARIVVRSSAVANRLAIHPYPSEFEETIVLADGSTVFVRPIRPETSRSSSPW